MTQAFNHRCASNVTPVYMAPAAVCVLGWQAEQLNCLYFLLDVPSALSRTFLRESQLTILDRAMRINFC